MATATPWLTLLEPLIERPSPASGQWDTSEPAAPVSAEAMRIEAEELLQSARTEAAELIEDAQVQAEALREAAWQEGHHEGKIAARAAAEAEVHAEWEERKAALRAEMEQIGIQIADAREQLWLRQESEMVALSLAIARQVVKTEVQQNPDVIRQVIANAIRRVTDKENLRIRVSIADSFAVKEMREDLLEVIDGLRHLEIIDDRRITDGGCVIETNAGTIDAKMETQLGEVARALGVVEDE